MSFWSLCSFPRFLPYRAIAICFSLSSSPLIRVVGVFGIRVRAAATYVSYEQTPVAWYHLAFFFPPPPLYLFFPLIFLWLA
ncbi:hypothetical protein F4805DRAFT_415905 [Annulohypoxylon moriforme]|nr:hypothetical protein F4805DRAFT_415905 [Annulohypoxylon moriforme]